MIWKENAVLITGGGFVNKGAEAMTITLVRSFHNAIPKFKIYLRIPRDYFDQARNIQTVPVNSDLIELRLGRWRSKLHMMSMILRCKAFLDIGGYQFGDPWGADIAIKRVKNSLYCSRFGTQVYYMPQAWGPFTQPSLADGVRSLIGLSELCYVRDRRSLETVESLFPEKNPKVRFAHDIAWNFEGADLSVGKDLLRRFGARFESGKLIVCITPNLRVYERSSGQLCENEYLKFIVDIIRYLSSRYSAQIVLLGHELRLETTQRDDRFLCRHLVHALAGMNIPVTHIDQYLSASEVKSIIGNCDLVISSRYHALIAALSQTVPAAALGWSHKYDELLNDLNMGSHILQMQPNWEVTSTQLDEIIKWIPQTKSLLIRKVPERKESARKAIEEVVRRIV